MKLKSTKSPSMEDLLSPSKLLFNPCQELHTGFISQKARLKHRSKYLLASSKNKMHRHFALIKDDISIENSVVVVCVLLTHFCFNVRLFSQVCFICLL